jgi:hypothetical protein
MLLIVRALVRAPHAPAFPTKAPFALGQALANDYDAAGFGARHMSETVGASGPSESSSVTTKP